MATIVFFHAHPDDEAISTGGTMALLAAAGHRVVLVTATQGEEGEKPDGLEEPLGSLRVRETMASASILGVARVEFLGYRDSGMMGSAANQHPDSFWSAEVAMAAERLATVLREENADIVVVYDDHGGYGHPDHIQVHRVGHRAAEIAGTARRFEATMNRDLIREHWSAEDRSSDMPSVEEVGTPDVEITTAVDVTAVLDAKRAAMKCHASQIAADSFFLTMPDEVFAVAFGKEWFLKSLPAPLQGAPRETSLLA